jgi:DNA-binding NtrC family response regulator
VSVFSEPIALPRPGEGAPPGRELSESLLDRFGLPEPPAGSGDLASATLSVPWRSPAYLAALSRLSSFARATHPILVEGESGAGKTAFAEVAHAAGRRPGEPFVAVNCASLPESLLESELFGHVRGAFTGADAERAGLIRAARSGTVFLDEIDKASRTLQAALLHVLDRREVRSVGGAAPERVHARFVFASNRCLADLAANGRFLPDLVYRIGGMSVAVPPLRERREDLDFLVALALREIRRDDGLAGVTVEAQARRLLASHDWPGNVRELFGVLRAAAHLAQTRRIGPPELELAAGASRLAAHAQRVRSAGVLAARVAEFERQEILLALRLAGGSQARAAERLGLSRRGLNKKLHRLELLEQLDREGLGGRRMRPEAPLPRAGPAG